MRIAHRRTWWYRLSGMTNPLWVETSEGAGTYRVRKSPQFVDGEIPENTGESLEGPPASDTFPSREERASQNTSKEGPHLLSVRVLVFRAYTLCAGSGGH